jgi:MATE family multidrug resistance protein
VKALDREILRLALPSILANITVPLVGLVDTAVAGHLHSVAGSSAEFIGGISAGAMVLNVIY